jgi:hypothetical protein
MYRSLRDHAVINVLFENGELRLGNRPLRVELQGSRIRMIGEESTTVYEKVEPWTPVRADLEGLVGEYASDEAETSFTVVLDGDRLVLRQRPATRIALTPTYRDAFSSGLGSIRFLRDASGKVTEFSLGESRVWDLRFRRVR